MMSSGGGWLLLWAVGAPIETPRRVEIRFEMNRWIRSRIEGTNRRNPRVSVMKPGEIKNAPETSMAAPCVSSRPGRRPSLHLVRIAPSTAMPARRTSIEPMMAVSNARPRAQPRPIRDSTQKKVAISIKATKAKIAKKGTSPQYPSPKFVTFQPYVTPWRPNFGWSGPLAQT